MSIPFIAMLVPFWLIQKWTWLPVALPPKQLAEVLWRPIAVPRPIDWPLLTLILVSDNSWYLNHRHGQLVHNLS